MSFAPSTIAFIFPNAASRGKYFIPQSGATTMSFDATKVAARIRRALPFVAPERVVVAPDCGMKYLPREAAFGKIKAMVEGAKLMRAELGRSRQRRTTTCSQ